MEVVVKPNDANKPMHNQPYVLGYIAAPDSHYVPRLFSHYEATKSYNKMDQDIFEAKNKAKPADRSKTPKSVLYGLGLAALTTIFLLIKKLIFKK